MNSLLSILLIEESGLGLLRVSSGIARDVEESVALFAGPETLAALATADGDGFLARIRSLCSSSRWMRRIESELRPDSFLSTRLEQWNVAHRMLVADFAIWSDRLRIAFGVEGPILEVRELGGDPHGLQGVFLVEFANGGPLVYRHRPVDTDHLWDAALRTLNASIKDALALPRCPSVGDRKVTWQAFAQEATGESADHERLLGQWGLLLSLAHMCRLNDAHRGNFVVTETGPVLVDTETLLAPPVQPRPADPIAELLEASITSSLLRSGMLPRPRRTHEGWVDLSPLSPRPPQRVGIARRPAVDFEAEPWVKWASTQLEHSSLIGLAQCAERLGVIAAVDLLVAGYEAGIAHSREVASALQERSKGASRRRVLRPTYQYREELLRRRLDLRPPTAASWGVLDQQPIARCEVTNQEEKVQMDAWQVPLLREPVGSPEPSAKSAVSRSLEQVRASLLGVTSGRLQAPDGSPLDAVRKIVRTQTSGHDSYIYDAAVVGDHFLTYPTGLSLTSGIAGIVLTLDRFDPASARIWREAARDWLRDQCIAVSTSRSLLPAPRLVPGGPIHGLLFLVRTSLSQGHVAQLVNHLHGDCAELADAAARVAIRYCLGLSEPGESPERPSGQVLGELIAQGLHHSVGYWLLDALATDDPCPWTTELDPLVKHLLQEELADPACAVPLTHLRMAKRPRATSEIDRLTLRSSGLDGIAGLVWQDAMTAPSTRVGW